MSLDHDLDNLPRLSDEDREALDNPYIVMPAVQSEKATDQPDQLDGLIAKRESVEILKLNITDMCDTAEYGCEEIEGIVDLALMALDSPKWEFKRDAIRQALRVIGERARWTCNTITADAEDAIGKSEAQEVDHG